MGNASGGDDRPRWQGATLGDSMNDGAGSGSAPGKFRLGRGESIDRYVVLYELGSGGMGVVYAAYDPELDRKVAVKVLHADDSGSRGRRRLLREAKAIARLSHPNVVTVHDVGTYEGRVFVAMEFIDGVTFRQWVLQARRSWQDVVAVLRTAGKGLAAAHAADLIHRDFKPDNILVERGGRVVVLDFGLARRAGTRDEPGEEIEPGTPVSSSGDTLGAHLTRTGAKLGTPAYMAPEQHLSAPTDARTDQFSFCIVMWEALYGVRPFRGENQMTTAMQVVTGQMQEPPKGAAVPAWIRRVLERGLASDPGARYRSMQELLDALARDPSRRRRRWLTGAGVALVLAAGAGGLYLSAAGEAVFCEGGEGRWSGVWDDARRRATRAALLSTGATFAQTAWVGVEHGLDAYVGDWIAARRDACEATHVLHEQSTEMMDLRMACLRNRRADVAALIDELVAADASVAEHAVEAVRSLPRLEDCNHAELLATRVRPPQDQEVRLAVDRVRAQLADARAKEYAGHYDQANAIATAVLEAAGDLDYPPVVAEAELRLASILERRGDFAGSEEHLFEAIWAAEASHHEEVVAEAWVRLVWVGGVERVDVQSGHRWARFARAAVDRLGGSELLEATLVHNLGGVLYREGRLEEALDHYRRALAVQQRILGTEDPAVAMTLNHIGNVLMEQHQYGASREYCERSLALRRAILGEQHPKVAASLNNIAEIYRKQGDAERSLDFARQSLAITGGTGGPEEAIALVLAAEALDNLGRPAEAARDYERLLALRTATLEPGDPAVAGTLVKLGRARVELEEYDAAVSAYERVIEIQRADDPRAAVRSLMAVAEARVRQGRDAEAVAALQEASRIAEAVAQPDDPLPDEVEQRLGAVRGGSRATTSSRP